MEIFQNFLNFCKFFRIFRNFPENIYHRYGNFRGNFPENVIGTGKSREIFPRFWKNVIGTGKNSRTYGKFKISGIFRKFLEKFGFFEKYFQNIFREKYFLIFWKKFCEFFGIFSNFSKKFGFCENYFRKIF